MNQKTVIAILGVVVIVLIGTTVYFAMTKNVSQPATTASNVVQQPTPTPVTQEPSQPATNQQSANQPTNETASWQTYKSIEDGIELKYPKDWIFSQNGAVRSTNFRPKNGDVAVVVYFFGKKTIDEAEKLLPIFSVPTRTVSQRVANSTINNISWEKLVVEEQNIYMTYHNGTTFAVQFAAQEENGPGILSTFKFTN